MDDKNKYEEMSNSELKLKMKKLEDEYETIKRKINLLIDRMEELDEEFYNVNNVFLKRTKGFDL